MKSIFTLIIILAAGCFLLFSCSSSEEQSFTGLVEGTTVQVPALTGGKILKIYVDTGSEVEEGTFIAQVDTTELILQRQQLTGALEEIESQRGIARTNLAKAEKDFAYAAEKHGKFVRLLETETVNQQTVDDLENRLTAAELAVRAANQNFNTLSAKQKQAEAQLKIILKKIKDTAIISPINGIVSEKYYEAGEAIPMLRPLVEIVDLREVWVKIYLAESMLPAVNVGQTVEVHIDGLAEVLSGKISWISTKSEFTPKHILTPDTRKSLVYAAKVIIDNENKILKQGMPVEIIL